MGFVSNLDETKLEIDFLKHDLAHVYCLKSKFKIDYSRKVPMRLFNKHQYLHRAPWMVETKLKSN